LDLIKQCGHNLREHESSYRVASLHENWTSVSSRHSAKKNYNVVTSYQFHVSTKNYFQILDSLKESDSPVEETVRKTAMIAARNQELISVQDHYTETFNIPTIINASFLPMKLLKNYIMVQRKTTHKQRGVSNKISKHKIVTLGGSHRKTIVAKLQAKL
jgi:hypothetical protein